MVVNITDEIPFDVPDSWTWARISQIGFINPRSNLPDETEVGFIPMPLIREGYANCHSSEVRKWNDVKNGFSHFAENDIGVAKITPCFENRKSVIFTKLPNGFGAGTTELHIVRLLNNTIMPEYLLWCMKTDAFINDGINAFSGAVGQKRIGKDFISRYLVPIPPQEEQVRIIKMITDSFLFLSDIEKSIN